MNRNQALNSGSAGQSIVFHSEPGDCSVYYIIKVKTQDITKVNLFITRTLLVHV